MKIHMKHAASAIILELEGDFISELDQLALRDKVYALVKENKKHIIIDFAGVKYINSCGLGSLVCIFTTLRKAGGELRLARVGHDVESVLKLTNLNKVFDIFPSIQSAMFESSQRD